MEHEKLAKRNFVVGHGILPICPQIDQILALFVDIKKFGISLESPHFQTVSA